uniref:Interleukin-2 receptor subunit alpha n=1 Tax=Oryctolagus cuniculus TaxID=9986 RepID=A0A5F9DFX4_RABIT
MEPRLLLWGLVTFIMVPGFRTDFCDDPPQLSKATFRALAYKIGTMLTCDCEAGFRRVKYGSSYMLCTGNSSHSFWDNRCQCTSNSLRNPENVTTQPEEQTEGKPTEMQSQMEPEDHVDLPGHCKEPPPWEHEAKKRIYHFVVGQTVHYQCVQGFRALQRHPAVSVCKMACEKTSWTLPLLTCAEESQHHQFPGEEEPQASMDAPPESKTSCPVTTTDFQKHTEVATTMETFLFTEEYQIAGRRVEEQSRKEWQEDKNSQRSYEAQAKSKMLNTHPTGISVIP